jgi:hypothetical protein
MSDFVWLQMTKTLLRPRTIELGLSYNFYTYNLVQLNPRDNMHVYYNWKMELLNT